MDVSLELTRLLGSDDIPLDKRIHLAKNSFVSHHLPAVAKEQVLESKEEVSLKWLCALIENKTSPEGALLALRECLTSKRVKNYKFLYISPLTRKNLISTLSSIGSVNPEECLVLVECYLCLFEIPLFQQHFNCSPSDYSSLVGSLLKCLCYVEKDCLQDLCQKFSSIFSVYAKKFHLNRNFEKYFFMKILSPLSLFVEVDRSPLCQDSFKELKKCTNSTLFPPTEKEKRHGLIDSLFISLIQGNENLAVVEVNLFQHLHSLSTTVELNEFLSILSVTFKAFMASCPKDGKQQCQVFLIICYLLGLKPVVRDNFPSFSCDVSSFFSLPVIPNHKKNMPYKCLKVLIGALNEAKVNLNVEVGGHSLISWLRGMCECLVFKEDVVDELAVSVLTDLSDLDPSILDAANSNRVLGPTMLKRPTKKGVSSKKNSQLYNDFLQSLLNSSIKLHRTQKLASRILSSVKEELNRYPSLASRMTVEDILPESFCTNFGGGMQFLVVSQALAMLRTLMFHLFEDCVVPMENGQCGPPVVLLLQSTKCLLCAFIVGYKAIDPNIPEAQAKKFSLLMAELGGILGRLGRALLLEKHNPDTIGAFLELTLSWGDLQLLLMFYRLDKQLDDSIPDFAQIPPVTSNKLCGNTSRKCVGSPTDFSGLHSYLTEGEWSHLVERIVNFGDEPCKETLDELVVQKMKMLVLFEPDPISDKTRFCVQHLLSRACDSEKALALLVENEGIITPVLDDVRVNKIVELIVGKTAFGEQSFLKAFHDNPVIAPVAAMSLLKKIGESALIAEDKAKSSRKRRLSDHGDDLEVSPKRRKGHLLAHCIFQSIEKTPLSINDLSVASLYGRMEHSRSDSVLKLLEALSSTLSEYLASDCKLTKTLPHEKSVISFSALKSLIHSLDSLPLAHFGSDLRIVVGLCVIALLITAREHNQPCDEVMLAEIALSKVLLLSMKTFDVTKELANYLNIGDFLVWYISKKNNISSMEEKSESEEMMERLQQQIMERMVEVAMSTTSGLKHLKPVVKVLKVQLKEGGTRATYSLSAILMAAFSKKCGKTSSATSAVKQKYHKYCYSIAVSTANGVNFDPTNISEETLECFYRILQIIIPVKDQKRLNKMGEYLAAFVDMLKKRLGRKDELVTSVECANNDSRDDSCYVNFIDKLLHYRMYFKNKLPKMFAWDVWSIYINHFPSVDKKTFLNSIKTIYLSANKAEFVLMTKDLVDKLRNLSPKQPEPSKFQNFMLFWKSLVQVNLNKGLDVVRQDTLRMAAPMLLSFTRNWGDLRERVSNASMTENAVALLEFLRVLLRYHNVIYLNFIDVIFKIIVDVLGYITEAPARGAMQTSPATVERDLIGFQRILLSCASILLALVTHLPEQLMDRIATFLQLFGIMFKAVVMHGNVESSSSPRNASVKKLNGNVDLIPAGTSHGGSFSPSLSIAISCAMSLEWICNALAKFKKENVRISPYFIANLVSLFETNPVHLKVKMHLHNCIYVFIHFCDQSGLTYLQHSLPAGSREIFRNILENYKKFYRFKGKL